MCCAIWSASRAPACSASQLSSSHAVRPSVVPDANPRAAPRYSPDLRIQCTSGTPRPCGSSPLAIVTSRETARATTPSAVPNGASVSNSPCATAASTGAGALDPPVRSSISNSRRGPTSGSVRGRPRCSSSVRSAAASACSRASACIGARCHTVTNEVAPPSSASATRIAPAVTGSGSPSADSCT
ncbi:hypothetical protein DIQ86_33035, partial [Mycolicibacterium smegmatis]